MKPDFMLLVIVGAPLVMAQLGSDQVSEARRALEAAQRARADAERARAEVRVLEGTTLQQLLRVENGGVFLAGGAVKGRPFSATEESRSLQVLANGARIENNKTMKLYRDLEGRTRTEDAQGNITISDPVAGFRATLDPKTKTATRTRGAGGSFASPTLTRTVQAGNTGSELRERLGLQSVNGVTARGERVTITIPKGEIGNDRELKVVTERWTSEELQMLVKSSNRDPRYGDNTYELTNISLAVPDAALFQIPADYTVTESGTRSVTKAKAATPAPVAPAPAKSPF